MFLGEPKDNTQDMMNKGRHRGRTGPLSLLHRLRISAAKMGVSNGPHPHSEETKRKMSESAKARWAKYHAEKERSA
jgi:hypothetical protein